MKPKQLERRFTLAAELNDLLLAFLPVFFIAFISQFYSNQNIYLLVPFFFLATLCWLAYHRYAFKRGLKKHQAGLINLANTNTWNLQSGTQDLALPKDLKDASLFIVADRDPQLVNYLETPNWNYIDISYCVYERTKYGEYKSAYIYCSALVGKLPRVLPNVFFDSKNQKDGRKYKATFAKDQRHSLEGDFDNYFDTYFAEGYTIDSLSFITPDVMLALENAAEYDIEIIGDRLLLYGPVYIDANKILEGASKLQAILKTLQVTASAYHDDRLLGGAGRHTVTPQGLQLKRRHRIAWATIIFVILGAILGVISNIYSH